MAPPTTIEEYQLQKDRLYDQIIKDMQRQYEEQEEDLCEQLERHQAFEQQQFYDWLTKPMPQPPYELQEKDLER